MTESEERAYVIGSQRAYASMLATCLRELSPAEPRPNDWAVVQLAEVRIALRRVCEAFGDNDWPDDLHLADVIEKHLERHLEGEQA